MRSVLANVVCMIAVGIWESCDRVVRWELTVLAAIAAAGAVTILAAVLI